MAHTLCMHLVSDSTGETLHAVARAIQGRFTDIEIEQYPWPLTRTIQQTEDIVGVIRAKPGIVLCTVEDEDIQLIIQNACHEIAVPCIPVLGKVIQEIFSYLNMVYHEAMAEGGLQSLPPLEHRLYSRTEAIEYAVTHDDGQSIGTINIADIIIVGVSRTAKTPTSVYLAYRGYKVANVPYIPNAKLPTALEHCKNSLIVGLILSPDRLLGLRQNRVLDSHMECGTSYTDIYAIENELREAKGVFKQHNWPIIDVSKKSIEEIAATIIKYYNRLVIASGS